MMVSEGMGEDQKVTLVFCSLNNASLNGEVGPEVWLEEAKERTGGKKLELETFSPFKLFV